MTLSKKSAAALSCAVAMLAACEPSPVEWRGDARPLAVSAAATARSAVDAPYSESALEDLPDDEGVRAAPTRLALLDASVPALEPVAAPAHSPAAGDSSACIASVRVASRSPAEMYGVWWSRRAREAAWLVAARSDDGGRTWTSPVPVDTLDRSVAGCARPAPAIAADAASGYVHVTYFLQGPSGAGVFFSHSMERGALFHAPVAIMYGTRPVPSAVAAADSVVVVAFEDPNQERPRVLLAISRTWGHIFARERPEASPGDAPARAPLVAVRDSVVAVGWRGGHEVLARVGTLK